MLPGLVTVSNHVSVSSNTTCKRAQELQMSCRRDLRVIVSLFSVRNQLTRPETNVANTSAEQSQGQKDTGVDFFYGSNKSTSNTRFKSSLFQIVCSPVSNHVFPWTVNILFGLRRLDLTSKYSPGSLRSNLTGLGSCRASHPPSHVFPSLKFSP